MTEASTTRGAPRQTDPVGPLLMLVPMLLLAYTSDLGWFVAVVTVLVGVAGFVALGAMPWPRNHGLPAIPAITALAVVGATATPIPIEEFAAGFAAVALLLALGRLATAPEHRARVWRGAGIPILAFLLALATALVLPATRQFVGVAALLAVGAVAALALLFAAPDRADALEAEAS